MKWIVRVALGLTAVLVGVAVYAVGTAQGSSNRVGLETLAAKDDKGRAFPVAVWFPSEDRTWPTTFIGGTLYDVAKNGKVVGAGLPLIVISHGNGAGATSHGDLAMALASAGYVVASPMHPGDNFADQSAAGDSALFSDRAQQLRATLDAVTQHWDQHSHVDASRIGAYGFSAGGFTVMTLIGAVPDMARIANNCATHPEFICQALAQAKSPLLSAAAGAGNFSTEPRIRAAVIAAPGLGFTLEEASLQAVRVPLQLWSGERDDRVPYATNIAPIARHVQNVDVQSVEGAGHLSFLAPCGLLRPAGICEEQGDFDREAFHQSMNASVVAFFDRTVKGAQIGKSLE